MVATASIPHPAQWSDAGNVAIHHFGGWTKYAAARATSDQ
jgi:hypothetical protein